MTTKELAEQAAFNSALISGYEPTDKDDARYRTHLELMESVFACTTGLVLNPIIINMTLCGDRSEAQYRAGIRAADAGLIPDAKFVRPLFDEWWLLLLQAVPLQREKDEVWKRQYCWDQHNHLMCLEPFARANGRTARVLYYSLGGALGLPPKIILAAEVARYVAWNRLYRDRTFVPKMREQGFITS